MGYIIKTFFWGVAVVAGYGVGAIVAAELRHQYNDYRNK